VFNTVEGNTSFYRIPDTNTVSAWRDAVHERDFRFCFKLPRTVTHERQPDFEDLRRFLHAIEPLGEHLGPLFVQLPATVGPEQLGDLETLFDRLPSNQRAVLEVRDARFFAEPALLKPLLEKYHLGRVVLDSRPLFQGDLSHPDVQAALHAKPDLPVLPEVYNDLEFIRLILHPDLPSNAAYLQEWTSRIAGSLQAGKESYMMIHCPNNLYCPPLAEQFNNGLRQEPGCADLPNLAPWPVPQQGQLI
jgi:uncharacterized protein YecE (DUF72 family)